ncbi:hypothetical protein ENUP19_0050G0022 [Entamoeba nuttalli]|uniref:Leucine rich repeat protein, BspA family protein n=2 Tax=Entamoeba nuttalli TaxID=412467 RepID=K2GHN6_ENTNP|nr:leucine rich repeat protein, BspA family protein [Entamoeba nuttalli P19]EKE42211.1 leucine rich repeat protein, BspA family protein [Entamoeba nuttalli P19]|eukprot:XP_008855454.1 leucine rich repeat protein, BspA family protein [Entamoeba nuttalli P19]
MKQLDSYSMMIVAKYLNNSNELMNIVLVCRKNKELLDKFRFNPIPLNNQSKKLFHYIETQYLYSPEEERDNTYSNTTYCYPINLTEIDLNDYSKKYLRIVVNQFSLLDSLNNKETMKKLHITDLKIKFPPSITNFNILSSVTKLGRKTFNENTQLNQITLPNCIRKLGKELFYGCSNLTLIDFGYGWNTIKEGTFKGCVSLQTIKLSPFNSMCELTMIPKKEINIICNGPTIYGKIPYSISKVLKLHSVQCNKIYYGKEDLLNSTTTITNNKITIPKEVNIIESGCFNCNYTLKSIQIPEGITKLGKYSFYRCTSLTSIQLPSTLKIIKKSCFGFCENLIEIEIPQNVKEIPTECFIGCNKMKRIKVKKNISIAPDALTNCNAIITY